jgi:hypothetical protein
MSPPDTRIPAARLGKEIGKRRRAEQALASAVTENAALKLELAEVQAALEVAETRLAAVSESGFAPSMHSSLRPSRGAAS